MKKIKEITKEIFEELYTNDRDNVLIERGNLVVYCDRESKFIDFKNLASSFGYDIHSAYNYANSCRLTRVNLVSYHSDLEYYQSEGCNIVSYPQHEIITEQHQEINGNNKMAEVAKLLGVELEEEFQFVMLGDKYKFTKEGLKYSDNLYGVWSDSTCIEDLLTGQRTIIKPPFQPKIGEEYYFPSLEYLDFINSGIFKDNICHKLIIKNFGAYRTIEEAKQKAKELWNIGDSNNE